MKSNQIFLNPNKLVKFLRKYPEEFTRYDIMKFIEGNNIKMLNLRYVAEDGKLKTLNFVINSMEHLEHILCTGERVDGSSLFSYIEAGKSDLYIIPRFKTAFVNPFSEIPTLDILCSFYTRSGLAWDSAPEFILRKAHKELKKNTGFTFKAMGELEYYIISPKKSLYPAKDQKAYHTSSPFTNWEHLRAEAMNLISEIGGKIKYGHSEVGNFFTETKEFEQHEIEFLPVDVEDAADQLVLAKWVLRMLGEKYGVTISFAPKITVGKAGSGLHIHFLLEKDGKNLMIENKKLSDIAKKSIAGLMKFSKVLTAFGNTIPTSYLRLVPHQEAPTNICWGDYNRSVLVRVPLGWIAETQMIKDANPNEKSEVPYVEGKQTVELRSPDGSADIYHLLAGMVLAVEQGLSEENSLNIAEKTYVAVNIFNENFKDNLKNLEKLPRSCWKSADELKKTRKFFEKNGVFPKRTIDGFIKMLKSYHDEDLSERLYGKNEQIKDLVEMYIHTM